MKLSTKSRYGIATIYDLAMHYGQGPISLKSVAQRQLISENYLEQLIGPLRKSGLVRSVRGPQGGYSLNKSPDKISVGDIIKILEGPILPADCLSRDDGEINSSCTRINICVTRNIFSKLKDSMDAVLNSITIADLLEENKPQGD